MLPLALLLEGAFFMAEPRFIRVTEIDSFFTCGHRWKLQQDGEIMQRESMPLIRGGAVHASREFAFNHWLGKEDKKTKGKWPSYDEMVLAGNRDFLMRAGGESAQYDDERGEYMLHTDSGEKVCESDVMAEIAPYVAFDRQFVLPHLAQLEIVACEERWELPLHDPELKDDYVITGKVDLLVREIGSGRLALHDLKTGSKIQQADADQRQQLAGYSAGIHAEYGEYPMHALGSPRFLKNKPKKLEPGAICEPFVMDAGTERERTLFGIYETVSTDRNEHDVQVFLARLKQMLLMVEANVFPPAASGFMSECYRCELAKRRKDRCAFAGTAGGKA